MGEVLAVRRIAAVPAGDGSVRWVVDGGLAGLAEGGEEKVDAHRWFGLLTSASTYLY